MNYEYFFYFVIFSIITLSLFLFGKKHFILYLLIASIYLGPRIPLRQLTVMQRIDIRIDDILILLIIFLGLIIILTGRKRTYPIYTFFIAAFVVSSLLSTIIATVLFNYPLFRSLVYWFKEVEYISLLFFVPYLLDNEKEKGLTRIICTVFVVTFLNACWLFYQIMAQQKMQLLNFVSIPSYGYCMIGESQPFQTGSLWSFSLLISFSCLVVLKKWKKISGLIFIVSLIGLVSTFSRSCIIASLIALTAGSMIFFRQNRKTVIFCLLFLCCTSLSYLFFDNLVLVLKDMGLPVFRIKGDAVHAALTDVRYKSIWLPLLESFLRFPLLGYGKGNIINLLNNYDEAHNYYLRCLIETGIIGTCMFVIYQLNLFFHLIRSISLKLSPVQIVFVYLTIVNLIFTFVVSWSQDSLYSSKIAIPFYFSIGIFNYIYADMVNAKKNQPSPSIVSFDKKF